MTKLLQNLSTLYLSNTVHIDTSPPEASAEESTPSQPVDQLVLIPLSEKMRIASQLVGMFTQEAGSPTETTPEKGVVTVAKGTTVSALLTNKDNSNKRSVRDAVLDAMKKQFYKVYGPMYDEAQEGGSGPPTKEKYDQYVEALQCFYTAKKRDQFMKNTNTRFSLGTNLKDNNLFRKVQEKKKKDSTEPRGVTLKKVIWYEKIFDVIHEAHLSLSHATYSRTHKILIDKKWWVVPETAIKVYISLCPECLSTTQPPVAESLHPLKMMISSTIGKRAQMDLIDYRRCPCLGYRWILRYVDHHSGFAHVAPLKRKTAKQTGRALVRIMAATVIPEVLQSDNGSEFLGRCKYYINKFFKTVNIVRANLVVQTSKEV